MTIDEFLASLPAVERSLTLKFGQLEFRFEVPQGFEDISNVMAAGVQWQNVCALGFPKGSELEKYACGDSVAREIGVMVHCLKSPNWEHLDFMKLAACNGVVFGQIVNRFEEWLRGYFAYDFAAQVVEEKKD